MHMRPHTHARAHAHKSAHDAHAHARAHTPHVHMIHVRAHYARTARHSHTHTQTQVACRDASSDSIRCQGREKGGTSLARHLCSRLHTPGRRPAHRRHERRESIARRPAAPAGRHRSGRHHGSGTCGGLRPLSLRAALEQKPRGRHCAHRHPQLRGADPMAPAPVRSCKKKTCLPHCTLGTHDCRAVPLGCCT